MEAITESLQNNWNDFIKFMWNKETKEFAGRSSKSWAEIGLFYLIFYALLSAWWGGHLFVATKLLPELHEGPKHTEYLTHRGPGIHGIPQWDILGTDRQRIYHFNKRANYVSDTKTFLEGRKDGNMNDAKWGDCALDKLEESWNNFKPCFYFYFNRVHGFVPKPEEEGAPITITCKAARSNYAKYIDMENSKSFPETGMDVEKFPWKRGGDGEDDWDETAPLIAAQVVLNQAEFKNKAEVRVLCQAKAKNIILDEEKPNIGQFEFRLKAQ